MVMNEEVKTLVMKRMEICSFLSKTSENYNFDLIKDTPSKHRNDYSINDLESQYIERQLDLPYDIFKTDIPVLSSIYLKDETISLKKINEGGFSDIYTATV